MIASSFLRTLLLAGCGSLFWTHPMAQGAIVHYDLVCVLNNTADCAPGPSFGRVTITDTATDTVRIDVDLLDSGVKFKDMMLQVFGILGPVLNLTDPAENPLSIGTFSITPNPATFNLGSVDDPPAAKQGWNGNSGYVGVLQATGLSTASLTTNNGGAGQYYVAMHIQSLGPDGCSGSGDGSTACLPGETGNGSLKVGGLLVEPSSDETPEPWTFGFVGVGLLGIAALGRRLG